MIIAELEIYHSRPIAPTRRVALGQRNLPVEPAPGAGGLLLAGILGEMAPEVQPDLREHLYLLLEDLAAGRRIPQPRVRHRFQTDTVGLLRSSHRLVAAHGGLSFKFEGERGLPVQHALGALYAAGQLPPSVREPVFESLRSALVWGQPVDERFISAIMGGRAGSLDDLKAWNDPVAWALETLGLEPGFTRRNVLKRYRVLLRDAHPDHGAAEQLAAARIAELGQARDILL
ncbi:MAG: J domain-containing protein [Acidimicrobiales bacterium]|nr:J domain-containing protein [Acidimicrobiales bacterium]